MSKWLDFSIDERKAMMQGVVAAKHIDEAAAEKDWWVTAILYALFHTEVAEYLLKFLEALQERFRKVSPRVKEQ